MARPVIAPQDGRALIPSCSGSKREIRVHEKQARNQCPGSRSTQRYRRIRRESLEVVPPVVRNERPGGAASRVSRWIQACTFGAAARAAAWRPPPDASRRSHRHEVGSPVVIFPKIGKELASWPFCLQFSEKARREIRDRVDETLRGGRTNPPPRGPGSPWSARAKRSKRWAREELALRGPDISIVRPRVRERPYRAG